MRVVVLGPIVDRIGRLRAMRLGALFLIVGLAVYPLARNLWQLALLIPLVPVGTALLFPSTTALMSRVSEKDELGTTMGVAQTYAEDQPDHRTALRDQPFQYIGHGAPFYAGSVIVALVSILAFHVDHIPMHTGRRRCRRWKRQSEAVAGRAAVSRKLGSWRVEATWRINGS